MAVNDPRNAQGSVEAALARVLLAEREARDAIEAAQAEAQRIAERSRAGARRCAERARERVARGQDAMERRLQQGLAAIEAEARALPELAEPGEHDRARLEAAVQALAVALTGGDAARAPAASSGPTEGR